MQKGEIIKLVTYDVDEDGYWKGILDGREGLFPNNFVTQYTPTEVEVSSEAIENTASHSIAVSETEPVSSFEGARPSETH